MSTAPDQATKQRTMPDAQVASMFNPFDTGPYFEVESTSVGARYAISVALPAGYDPGDGPYPVLYVADGNILGPLSSGVTFAMFLRESIVRCRPFVQVNIGYPPEDAAQMLVIRNRDLVPPGEPIAPELYPYIAAYLGIDRGLAPQGYVDAFFESAANGHGDNFLAFIEHELHPRIEEQFNVDRDDIGFFGYSYGGLLSLYALCGGSRFFAKVGAGSPAVTTDHSVVLPMYGRLLDSAPEPADTHLHLSINIEEMEGAEAFYRKLGLGALRFLDMVKSDPLPGLTVTSEMIPGQDHEAGFVDAYRSFVRHAYAQSPSVTA